MTARVLVTGAGGGPGNNLIRSLRAADPTLAVVGTHTNRFVLKKSAADRNHLTPPPGHPGFADALRAVVAAERIDLLIPNSDADVRAVSELRARIPCRLFLPAHRVIELCQDKYELAVHLRARGVPVPVTCPVTDLDSLDTIFARLGARPRFWCRVRSGAGSLGAIPVVRAEQARAWIAYWQEMRGVPASTFTVAEYLPGRDFAVQGLWKDGALVLLKTCERLSYFGGGSQPSGASSTPALGKLVHDPRVAEVGRAAIAALDPAASGVFSIDLKEDAAGTPCVTEINAGRFCMITNVFDLTGKHSMALTYVRLALGAPVEAAGADDVAEDYYLVRDLDTLPGIFHAEEFFEGIHETGDEPRRPRRRTP
jgi:carbamoyl-phosphate synthase large subunit